MINQIIEDIIIEDAHESLDAEYGHSVYFRENLRRNISKALSIKESEHQEQLKEIREKMQLLESNMCNNDDYTLDKVAGLVMAIDILNQYIKG